MPMGYDDRDDEDDDLDIRQPVGTVPNYLVQAILVTLCCCLPFGIAAIVNAAKVNTHLARGEYDRAVEASNEARKWCVIGFIVGIPTTLIFFWLRTMGEMR